MSKKVKGILAIIFMSLTFFLTIETKFVPALGDFVLEFFGISPWTGDKTGTYLGDETGTHLTVIYFGIMFIFSLFLVDKYAIERLSMKKKSVFLIFLVLVTSYTFVTGMTAQYIKGKSEGLEAIAYNSDESNFSYEAKDGKIVDLNATFSLKNYSNEKKEFFISLDSPSFRAYKIESINIINQDGTSAIFVLQAGESKRIRVTLETYDISGGRRLGNSYSHSGINEMVLSNKEGNVVKLTKETFFGMTLVEE